MFGRPQLKHIINCVTQDCVLAIPFIGRLSRVFECLYVGSRPESPEQGEATTPLRVNHVSDAIVLRQDAMQQHDELPNLAIFPEGTTSNGLFLSTCGVGFVASSLLFWLMMLSPSGWALIARVWNTFVCSPFSVRILPQYLSRPAFSYIHALGANQHSLGVCSI